MAHEQRREASRLRPGLRSGMTEEMKDALEKAGFASFIYKDNYYMKGLALKTLMQDARNPAGNPREAAMAVARWCETSSAPSSLSAPAPAPFAPKSWWDYFADLTEYQQRFGTTYISRSRDAEGYMDLRIWTQTLNSRSALLETELRALDEIGFQFRTDSADGRGKVGDAADEMRTVRGAAMLK